MVFYDLLTSVVMYCYAVVYVVVICGIIDFGQTFIGVCRNMGCIRQKNKF